MIFIALGANLPSQYGTPAETLRLAKRALINVGVHVMHSSRIWLTAPVPFDPDQDWYHNAVLAVETKLPAHDLLKLMFEVEEEFGRVRSVKNAPRVLDLDLIAYHDEIINDDTLIVPHPRMHERLFVLKPLQDVDGSWSHPISRLSMTDMLSQCDEDQRAKPMEGDNVL